MNRKHRYYKNIDNYSLTIFKRKVLKNIYSPYKDMNLYWGIENPKKKYVIKI